MELARKVYTVEELEAQADEIGMAMTYQLEQLLTVGDLPTVASLISFRLGIAVLNHNCWSRQADHEAIKGIVDGNTGDITYSRKMAEIMGDERLSKLSDGKQKAIAEEAAATAYQSQGAAKAEKAKRDLYKNFWQEWISYLVNTSELARHVAMHKLVEAKINQVS